MTKKVYIVILHTIDKLAPIWIEDMGERTYYIRKTIRNSRSCTLPDNVLGPWHSRRHIYFLSDDEIKDGDAFIHSVVPKTLYIKGSDSIGIGYDDKIKDIIYDCYVPKIYSKKVIASTDLSLNLPSIPEKWITEVFVPSNGSIKEIELDMEHHYNSKYGASFRLKLYSNDVCIHTPDENNSKQLQSDMKISIFCEGEKCSVCKAQATHKLEEVIFDDDPLPTRHANTNYVCTEHFNMVIKPYLFKKEHSFTELDMINAIKAGRQLYLYESDGSLQKWLQDYINNF